jgi:hypothetical protein
VRAVETEALESMGTVARGAGEIDGDEHGHGDDQAEGGRVPEADDPHQELQMPPRMLEV